MDSIINLLKNLDSTDIGIIIGIVAVIAFILILIIKGTILQLGIRILTKKRVAFYYMIIPTFIALLTNAILIFIAYLIVTANGIDVIETAFAYLFKSLTDYTHVIYILLALLGAEILFLVIQAFILKLITFDIIKAIKKLYCKIAKKEFVDNTDEEPETTKLTYVNGLLSGLFCFAIMFFLSIILIYIGELSGGKVLELIE